MIGAVVVISQALLWQHRHCHVVFLRFPVAVYQRMNEATVGDLFSGEKITIPRGMVGGAWISVNENEFSTCEILRNDRFPGFLGS